MKTKPINTYYISTHTTRRFNGLRYRSYGLSFLVKSSFFNLIDIFMAFGGKSIS